MSLSSNQPAGRGQYRAGATPFPASSVSHSTGPIGTRSSGPLSRGAANSPFPAAHPGADAQAGNSSSWDAANFSFPAPQLQQKASGSSSPRSEERKAQSSPLRPKPQSRRSRNLFLDLPIAGRLALGFVIAALVAGLAAGLVGVQRSQSLSKQTDFYHHLLQVNTSLTTGHSFLQLMNSELSQMVQDAAAPDPSYETLNQERGALNNLATLYTQTLNAYVQQDLLNQHPDQMALLNEANQSGLAQQQLTLTGSTQRTWQFYLAAQQQIIGYLSSGKITPTELKNAQLTLKLQAQLTNADAVSALHSLIQLDDRLASAVDNATNVEIQNELFTTLIAVFGAFILIALVGWFISDTLVRRLNHLHRVTRAVEEGRINERVLVAGRDEIAEVSLAVNAMVDTIVGLLEETRQQRDALTGAAEHLFSDMRIANAGDLRINATVSNDPIGMLANAFNFTVGRFRRFLLRTQTSVEQLEVVARQGQERSSAFVTMVRAQLRDISTPRTDLQMSSGGVSAKAASATPRPSGALRKETKETPEATPKQLLSTAQNELNTRFVATRETLDRASLSLGRLSNLLSDSASRGGDRAGQAQLQEVNTLEQILRRLSREVRQAQQSTATSFARFEEIVAEKPASAGSVAQEIEGNPAGMSEAQYQEFVRQAGSFAVEVNALARRLAAIIQEMRSSITPFHLEGGLGDEQKNTPQAFEPEQFVAPTGGLASWS